ncbi:MAG: GTP-dependent dephospho-CoA kinase family protein [Thermoproteota archaeon]|nr:GTP-dependent dephospho-CoA kinase family protein [Thermoproteota archaeon]
MRIKPEIIEELKKPQGILIPDQDSTPQKIRKYLSDAKKVVTVGDHTTNKLLSFGIIPDISVIDGYERRKKKANSFIETTIRSLSSQKNIVLFSCVNPAGGISVESMSIIKISLESTKPVIMQIIGEEDLLALPFFFLARNDSIICYGQPLEGMVVVRVTDAVRKKAKKLIEMIEYE